MGKCAYTSLILYRNFFSTPSNKFWMWLHTLRRAEICLDFAKYIRALTLWFFSSCQSSIGRCLKSRLSVPNLPVTSTCLDLIVILTPLGTVTDSSDINVFMAMNLARTSYQECTAVES